MVSATDTLKTAETMREAGVPDRQAEGIARAVDDACVDAVSELVTREHLRAELFRALLIHGGVIVGAVVALVKLLP